MFAVMVTVHIKPEKRDEFIKEMILDGEGSIANEEGCLLFNIIEDKEDPNCLHLYEVYTSEKAFEIHEGMPHFKRWVETTADLLAKPLEVATGTHLFPADSIWKKQE
ncbi:putative quinol monooxygenase [Pseudodesulfovibrio cashew]|nr:putative quinol monooxygenase [Pseudodesulfovibrio cashew]